MKAKTKEVEIEVPPIRVRFFDASCDETFDGTVMDITNSFYVVIPDYNLGITVGWRKINCDILR